MSSNEKAQEYYRKMINGSTYERFFGKYTEMNDGEAEILKYKKFSDLNIASVLSQMALAYIENWTQLGEDVTYINSVIYCLRAIFTFIKSMKPATSRHTE